MENSRKMRALFLFLWGVFIVPSLHAYKDAYEQYCPMSNKLRSLTSKLRIPSDANKKWVTEFVDRNIALKLLYKQKPGKLLKRCYSNYYTAIHNLIDRASFKLMKDSEYQKVVGDFYFFDTDYKRALVHYKEAARLDNNDYQATYRVINALNRSMKQDKLTNSKKAEYEREIKKAYKQLVSNPRLPTDQRMSFQKRFWYLGN